MQEGEFWVIWPSLFQISQARLQVSESLVYALCQSAPFAAAILVSPTFPPLLFLTIPFLLLVRPHASRLTPLKSSLAYLVIKSWQLYLTALYRGFSVSV